MNILKLGGGSENALFVNDLMEHEFLLEEQPKSARILVV